MRHLGDTLGHLLAFLRSFVLVPKNQLTDDFAGFGLSEPQLARVLKATRGWIVDVQAGNFDLHENWPGEADQHFASMLNTRLVDL